MIKPLSQLIVGIMICATALGQNAKHSYYEAIQQGAKNPIQSSQFKKIEEDALKDFTRPESYDLLAITFGNTTEKVWAVIYGEVYCNLSPDADRRKQLGTLVFQWYEKAFVREGNQMTVTLSENAVVNPRANQPPFESNFEISLLLGSVATKGEFNPLSIRTLADTRRQQLAMWNQKKLPKTELIRWQEAIATADHFEAYNYWLFENARAEEFNKWEAEHHSQYNAWLDWKSKNKFNIKKPDFQRIYLKGHT
ncbi:MAG: hypothetical protein ACHQKY_02490 [Terriglobia bacterium]